MKLKGEASVLGGEQRREGGGETERRASAGGGEPERAESAIFGSKRNCLHIESAILAVTETESVESGDRLCGGVVLAGGASSGTDPACGAQHLDLALSGEQARPGLVYWTL